MTPSSSTFTGPCIDFLPVLETPLFGIEEPPQADDHQGFLEIAPRPLTG